MHYDLLHNTVEDSATGSLTCRSGMRDQNQIDERHKTDLVFGGGDWVDLGTGMGNSSLPRKSNYYQVVRV